MLKIGKARARAVLYAAACALGIAMLAPAAHSQPAALDRSYSFNLPAQPLAASLAALSRQSGIQVFAAGDLVAGRQAPAVSGSLTARDALARLLAGSGLEAASSDAGFVVQRRRPASQVEQQLPEVLVVGEQGRSEGYKADVATTATKTDTPIMQTPASIQVVPEEVIRDQQAITLDDALKNVSGITQGDTFGNTRDLFILRGFQSQFGFIGQTGILRDGFKSISSQNLSVKTDRVEVLKGPASSLYGVLEPGGLVNVVSKQPQPASSRALNLQMSDLGLRRGWVDLTGPAFSTEGGTGMYRLILEREDSDYWRNFGEIKRTFAAAAFTWKTDRTRTTLSYESVDRDVPIDFGTVFIRGRPAGMPRERQIGEPFARMTERINLGELLLEYDISPSMTLRTKGAYQRVLSDDLEAVPVSLDESTGDLKRRVQGSKGRDIGQAYLSVNLISRFHTASLRHELLAGFDWERYRHTRDSFIRGATHGGFNIFNPVYGLLDPAKEAPLPNSSFDIRQRTSAFYLQDALSLTESITLVGGGRYERFDQFADFNAFGVFDDSQGSAFLPRLGLVYRPKGWLSFYASYGESYKPNASTPTQEGQGVGPFDPERGVLYETGVKTDFAEGLSATVAAYRIAKKNVMVFTDVPRTMGEVRSQGIEMDLAGKLTSALSIIASYAYTGTEVIEDGGQNEGNEFAGAARNTASLFMNYRFHPSGPLGGFSLGGGARYVGKRPGDPANSFFLPAYATADLYGAYAMKIGNAVLEARLNVKNLFDKTYFPSAGDSSPLKLLVGEPRRVFVTVSLLF